MTDLMAFLGILVGSIAAGWFWLKRKKASEEQANFKRYAKTLDKKDE